MVVTTTNLRHSAVITERMGRACVSLECPASSSMPSAELWLRVHAQGVQVSGTIGVSA